MAASEVSTRNSGRPVTVNVFVHSSACANIDNDNRAHKPAPTHSRRRISPPEGPGKHTTPRSQTQIRERSKRGSPDFSLSPLNLKTSDTPTAPGSAPRMGHTAAPPSPKTLPRSQFSPQAETEQPPITGPSPTGKERFA